MQLKREKMYKERIHNQTRLSLLIPKAEAQNRMLELLVKIREIFQVNIREIANEQGTKSVEVSPTPRAWTEYLTGKYNALIDRVVDDEMVVKSWAEDGSTKVLRTRLMQADSDKDIDEIIAGQVLNG